MKENLNTRSVFFLFPANQRSCHVPPFVELFLGSQFISLCTLSLPLKMKRYD